MTTEPSTSCFEDRAKLAWVAGILEGEGWFGLKENSYAQIKCKMTDEDVVRRLQEWTGAGTVCGPYLPDGLGSKPVWRWQLAKRVDVLRLCVAILPFMGQRRSVKVRRLIAYVEARLRNPVRKRLSDNEVREIRRRDDCQQKLAGEFGVTQQAISNVRCHRSYRGIA